MSIVHSIRRRKPYLEDKAETSGDRLERAEGICGVPHPSEEQLGRDRRSRPPVRFVLIHGSAWLSVLTGTKFFRKGAHGV